MLPNAVFLISLFGGVAVIPHNIISLIKNASHVLNILPTLCALLILSSMIIIGDFDAFFCEKECAIGYCRKHPGYVTIDYPEIPHTAFLGFPTKTRSQSFLNFLNRWLMIQEKTGFIASQYDYWILRKPKTNRAPRWNVLYNVFGFGFKNFKYKEGTNENIDYRDN